MKRILFLGVPLVGILLITLSDGLAPFSSIFAAQNAGDKKVWLNSAKGVYHCPESVWYGKTKSGQYIGECEALKAGYKPAWGKACGSSCSAAPPTGGPTTGPTPQGPSTGPPATTIPNLAANTPYDGLTFTGQTLRYYPLGNYQQCDVDCQNDPNCHAWSWVKPGGYQAGAAAVCYLVARVDTEVRHSCCISGLKSPGSAGGGPVSGPEFGTDGQTLQGNSFSAFGGTGVTSAQCKTGCDQNGSCAGWVLVKPGYPNPGCYLMASVVSRISNACCRSDLKAGANVSPPPTGGTPAANLPNLAGNWASIAHPGDQPRPTTIGQTGSQLVFTNELRQQSRGYFLSINSVIAQDWQGGLRATLSSDGNRLDWANASVWYRSTSITTGPPANTTSTGIGVSGNWQLTSTCGWYGDVKTKGTWAGTVTLTETSDGTLKGSMQNDALKPDFLSGKQTGNTVAMSWHPSGWESQLDLTGTLNGSRIDGKVHHYTNDDCTFSMVFLGNGTGEPTATTTTTTTTAPSNTIPNLAVNTAYDGLTFTGQNLRYFALGDYQQCQATCQNDPNCRGWSWVKPGGYKAGDPPVCYLVSRIDSEVRHPCCISGLKGAAPPASNPAPSGGTGPLAGNWKYAAQCGYGGFGGQVTISQTADGRFTGIMTGQYAGQIVNGQQSQSHITFTLIVNGSPGNWSGDLSGNKISGHFPCGGGSGNFTLSR